MRDLASSTTFKNPAECLAMTNTLHEWDNAYCSRERLESTHLWCSGAMQMDEPAAAVIYRIDSSRVTLREYAWGSKSPVALTLAAILKLFRVQIPSATDDPNVQTLSPFQVEPE